MNKKTIKKIGIMGLSALLTYSIAHFTAEAVSYYLNSKYDSFEYRTQISPPPSIEEQIERMRQIEEKYKELKKQD